MYKLNLTDNNELIVSYSQLNVWDRCKFQWHLGYGLGWTSKISKRYFDFGNLAHEFAALWYEHKRDGKSEDEFWVAYNEMIHQKYQDNPENPETLAEVVNLMNRYFSEYAPLQDRAWKVHEVEKHFLIPLTTPSGMKYFLQGYIDLLIEVDNKFWVLDHKSVGNAKGWSPVEVQMDAQMPTYAAALRTMGVDVFGVMFNFFNSYPYKNMKSEPIDKLFKRALSYRNDVELDNILLQTGQAVDEIYGWLEVSELYEDIQPRKSLKKDCSFCQFQEPCLMNVKGLNMDAFLEINFKQKGNREEESELTQPESTLTF